MVLSWVIGVCRSRLAEFRYSFFHLGLEWLRLGSRERRLREEVGFRAMHSALVNSAFSCAGHARAIVSVVSIIGLLSPIGVVVPGCGASDAGLSVSSGGGSNAKGRRGSKGGRGSKGRPSEPPIPVVVESARIGPISSYYTTNATLEVDRKAEVLSRVSGIIDLLLVEEGDEVKEGATLLRIENDEYQYQLNKATASVENFETQLARLEKSKNLVSAEVFDTARNNLVSAKAEKAVAQLNVDYTNVAAPFTGQIVMRHVDAGQNVSVGTPVFTIADFHPLLARVYIPAKEFRKIKRDLIVELVVDSTNVRLKGRITLVNPTIDPSTGTIKVTVEIPEYPAGTRPGDFAEVQITTERRPASILVVKHAVLTDKGEPVVYVQNGNIAERRVVERGFEDDHHAEILNGVQAGDRVVIKGHRTLKHGSAIKVLEESPVPSTLSSPASSPPSTPSG